MVAAGVGAAVLFFHMSPERPGSWKHRLKHAVLDPHQIEGTYRGTDGRLHDMHFCAVCHVVQPLRPDMPKPATDWKLPPYRVEVAEPERQFLGRWGLKTPGKYELWLGHSWYPSKVEDLERAQRQWELEEAKASAAAAAGGSSTSTPFTYSCLIFDCQCCHARGNVDAVDARVVVG
jgi:hypothetical protein